ncbi:glycerophosphoryl diester phosphodiesterase family protein [Geodermatophilus tzadiensis]|uniref:Glycerophosphoryl diester phosphodiesterase family protein n=1 Tax=Geodermatophilus tzadiensis TaxID=1137988 RepID=A0A2T0TTK8_9ACTN|nr:glycerophosphodiester phosphodiesterase family protein [Geodermatophilus tzadiensis]PRY48980.1 glycerophosphoryl diester phosphodiesterase family protein [Geodermatophilus tzadiensis]
MGRTPFAAVRDLRLPDGTCVPTLTEALELVARRRAFLVTEVEPEAGGAAGARTARLLAGLLHARRLHRPDADRVSTTSFDLRTAAALAGCGSVSGALVVAPHVDPDVAARRARDRGLTDVHLHPVHVRRDHDVVRRVRRLGVQVAVGVVNDPEEARLMARLGVDMVCTDDPVGLAHRRRSPVLGGGQPR